MDEETGINQREMDFYRAFERFVDRTLEIAPDAVLHSGDLFDAVRPTNRALSFALDQLIRITDRGIPVVIIAGNHSTPRLRETGSVMRVFDHIPGIHAVYRGVLERVNLGDMTVHALPHLEGEGLQRQLGRLRPEGESRFHVAMLHGGVIGLGVFKMDEFNETLINSSYLKEDFDYIALGHYHERSEVTPNACYSGSIERLSFSEANQKKGFLEVDLGSGKRTFHEIHGRPMIDLGPIEAGQMNHDELQCAVLDLLGKASLENSILRLVVRNIPSSVYRALDFHQIEAVTAGAVHFERRFEMNQDDISVQWTSSSIDSIEHEFVTFLERYPVETVDKDELQSRGLDYLKRGLEGSG